MFRTDFTIKPLIIIVSFFFMLFSIPSMAYGNENITIGVPYLPSKIDLLNDHEPITRILIKNLSASLIKKNEDKNPVAAHKIARRLDPTDQMPVWELEFTKGIPLGHQQNFQSSVIKDSFKTLKMLKKFPGTNSTSITELAGSIDSLTFSEQMDHFSAIFKLSHSFSSFPETLALIPLIDHSRAKVFGRRLGEGTNLPLYGPFTIIEHRPGEHLQMVRNEYFGFPGEQSRAYSVTFKVFEKTDSVMRALRAGSISIIALPCAYLIEDAKRDSTLHTIPSPLMNDTSKWKPLLSHWKDKEDNNSTIESEQDHEIDLKHIIVRKSMELTPEFLRSFDLKHISKGDL